MYCSCSNFQQLQPDCINPQLSHLCGKYQAAEPIKYVVCQHMYTEPVSIYDTGMTADGGKVETAFGFFDEIFHLPASAIKQDYVVWLCFHLCDNERVHMNKLVRRLLDLEDYSSCMRPGACLIRGLPINNGIVVSGLRLWQMQACAEWRSL